MQPHKSEYWLFPKIEDEEEFVARIEKLNEIYEMANCPDNEFVISSSDEKSGFYIKFFDDNKIFTNGNMAFTDDVLVRNNFPKSDIEKVGYWLYKDFENIRGDALHFKTRIKSLPLKRNENSSGLWIVLKFENSIIVVPLQPMMDPFNEFHFSPFDKHLSSQKINLSFLNLELEEWNTIEIKTTGKMFNLFINDSLQFQTQYEVGPGYLRAIQYEIKGMGEVDYVKFNNKDTELIYNNDFD